MKSKKIFFKNKKKQKLCGILEEPTKNKDEIVIVVHGYSSSKYGTSSTAISFEFEKRKINHFKIDLDGCGESEGDFAEQTVTSAAEDVLAAITEMKKQGYKKISLFGASGGGIPVMVAALKYKKANKVGLGAPVSDWVNQRIRKYGQKYIDDWKKKGYSYYMGSKGRRFKVNYSFIEDAKKYVMYHKVKSVTCPVLIIHGDKDESVSLENSKQLVKGFPNARLVIIKNGNHQLQINGNLEKAYALFGEFFEQQ